MNDTPSKESIIFQASAVIQRWHDTSFTGADYEVHILSQQKGLRYLRPNVFILNSGALKIQHWFFKALLQRQNEKRKSELQHFKVLKSPYKTQSGFNAKMVGKQEEAKKVEVKKIEREQIKFVNGKNNPPKNLQGPLAIKKQQSQPVFEQKNLEDEQQFASSEKRFKDDSKNSLSTQIQNIDKVLENAEKTLENMEKEIKQQPVKDENNGTQNSNTVRSFIQSAWRDTEKEFNTRNCIQKRISEKYTTQMDKKTNKTQPCKQSIATRGAKSVKSFRNRDSSNESEKNLVNLKGNSKRSSYSKLQSQKFNPVKEANEVRKSKDGPSFLQKAKLKQQDKITSKEEDQIQEKESQQQMQQRTSNIPSNLDNGHSPISQDFPESQQFQIEEQRSPIKPLKEIKQTKSRLFQPTASIKQKYGSRYSSQDSEVRNGNGSPVEMRKTIKAPPLKKNTEPEKTFDKLVGATKYNKQTNNLKQSQQEMKKLRISSAKQVSKTTIQSERYIEDQIQSGQNSIAGKGGQRRTRAERNKNESNEKYIQRVFASQKNQSYSKDLQAKNGNKEAIIDIEIDQCKVSSPPPKFTITKSPEQTKESQQSSPPLQDKHQVSSPPTMKKAIDKYNFSPESECKSNKKSKFESKFRSTTPGSSPIKNDGKKKIIEISSLEKSSSDEDFSQSECLIYEFFL